MVVAIDLGILAPNNVRREIQMEIPLLPDTGTGIAPEPDFRLRALRLELGAECTHRGLPSW